MKNIQYYLPFKTHFSPDCNYKFNCNHHFYGFTNCIKNVVGSKRQQTEPHAASGLPFSHACSRPSSKSKEHSLTQAINQLTLYVKNFMSSRKPSKPEKEIQNFSQASISA